MDNGIRNAKVVIACINWKYMKTENCMKELLLADELKKLVIPLLLEPLRWPPSGSQATILDKYHPLAFFHGSVKV